MLHHNNSQIDTTELIAKAQRLYVTAERVPAWPGEEGWQQSPAGRMVSLGASRQREWHRPGNYHALMQLPDADFIESAYLTLLGRLPGSLEFHDQLRVLYAEGGRETVLLSLVEASRREQEAGAAELRPQPLPGLKRGLRLARWKRKRKVGRVVGWLAGFARLGRLHASLQHTIRLQEARYATLLNQLRQQAHLLDDVQRTLNRMQIDNDVLRQQLSYHGMRPQAVGTRKEESGTGMPDLAWLEEGQSEERDFYRALEARFRGSPNSISDLMKEHLSRVHEVTPIQQGLPLLDLGSGRGEWLSLLRAEGILARGIDLNAANVRASREQGLDVSYQDAITALKAHADGSLGMVTSFHLVEHLQTDDIRSLLTEALRALAPGGRLLLETPNPENLLVSGCTFYLDPTHVRPIPPDFMTFLAEFSGFEAVQILPLHPVGQEMHLQDDSETARRLNHFLYGPQDYALLASKPAPQSQEPEA